MERRLRVFFSNLLRSWWLVLILFAVLLGPAAYYASLIRVDNSTDSLLLKTDPAIRDWNLLKERFGSDEFILIAFEADRQFTPDFLSTIDEIEHKLEATPHLKASRSLISIYREVHPLFDPHDPGDCEKLQKFAKSTPFFQKQGLIAPGRLFSLVLQLSFTEPKERVEVVEFVNTSLAPYEAKAESPFKAIRKVGQPYVSYELDRVSVKIGGQFFPLYVLFSALLIVFLYRSVRGMVAVLLTFGVVVAFSVAMVELTDSFLNMLSNILPLMVMIISLETLMHIYSGYVRQPDGVEPREHLVRVLSNKTTACFMAVFTTMVGFASFSTSGIQPIHDLGVQVTMGLAISFLVAFTLFPILLDRLRPPTAKDKNTVGFTAMDPVLEAVPAFTYRYRWLILPVAVVLVGLGIAAFSGMKMETNTIKYLSEKSATRQDSLYVEEHLMGLSSLEVMLDAEEGFFSKPENLRALHELESKLETHEHIQGTLSASTLIRTANHIANGKDSFPTINFRLFPLIAALSQQDIWKTYITKDFRHLRLSVISKMVDFETFMKIKRGFDDEWKAFVEKHEAFKDVKTTITGTAPMLAKVNIYLSDTLVQSFGGTLVIVFVLFLIQFRSFRLSLMAMTPSLFAIFLMFCQMWIMGLKLGIGTILLATIVLGISVDATIHFLYHFQEKRRDKNSELEDALRHTLSITGRALVLATMTIFCGFLIFALADFPPLEQFGILTGSAIVFGLFGDLLVLPALIWVVNRKEKPSREKQNVG